MVYRVFVEKKEGLDNEAKGLLNEAKTLLGMERLENVRLFNRYDAENITEDLFRYAVKTVFSEPQLDTAFASIQLPGAYVFAVEALPGQFDQRADSAAQCIQIISQGERPLIRTAKVYALYGTLTDGDIREFKKYVINPVECREASLDVPETLAIRYDIPTEVATLTGFTGLSRDELADFIANYGLAMDSGSCCWGRGQRDASECEAAAGCRNPYFVSEEKAAGASGHRLYFLLLKSGKCAIL